MFYGLKNTFLWAFTWKGRKGTFWRDRNILYFDCNGDYRGVHSLSQTPLSYRLKMGVFCGRQTLPK